MLEKMRGNRYIGLLPEVKTLKDERQRIEEQSIIEFAARHRLVKAEHIAWPHMGARERESLQSLLLRKKASNDFEFILIAQWSRLARGDSIELQYVTSQLEEHGIAVICARDDDKRDGSLVGATSALLRAKRRLAKRYAQQLSAAGTMWSTPSWTVLNGTSRLFMKKRS